LREALESCSTWVGSSLIRKYLSSWLGRLAREENYRLLGTLINYGRKSFITLAPDVTSIQKSILGILYCFENCGGERVLNIVTD